MLLAGLTMVSALLVAQPSNNNDVGFDGLFHDASSVTYVPNGPRTTLTEDVPLRFRSFRNDLTRVVLQYWWGAGWTSADMVFDVDVACGAGFSPPFDQCVLWRGTIPGNSGAVAYRFVAQDGSDQNFVGRANGATTSRVFDNGQEPNLAQSFDLPVPDAGGTGAADAAAPADAAQPPDAAQPVDASVPRDAALPPDASLPRPDAAVAPDASAGPADASAGTPDAATRPDAAAAGDAASPPDAALGADASRADAAAPPSDAGNGVDAAGNGNSDAGNAGCVPGCMGTTQRVVCGATGTPTVVDCTGGTECRAGACVAPSSEAPDTQGGCGCDVTDVKAPQAAAGAMVLLTGVAGIRRRRSRPTR